MVATAKTKADSHLHVTLRKEIVSERRGRIMDQEVQRSKEEVRAAMKRRKQPVHVTYLCRCGGVRERGLFNLII